MSCGPKKVGDWKKRKEDARSTTDGRVGPAPMKGKSIRCYRCQETGYVATQCGKSRVGRACFVCESMEHLARECSR